MYNKMKENYVSDQACFTNDRHMQTVYKWLYFYFT